MTPQRRHGGPDAHGAARWDFSTNANAAGPCPAALAAVQAAEACRYPDPSCAAAREALAALHAVDVDRIVVGASGSELIQRLTAVGALLQPGPVALPRHGYGDYRSAAHAWRREAVAQDDARATLRWHADPGSPLGQDDEPPLQPGRVPTVLDGAYAPLRLEGHSGWNGDALQQVIRLYSPNKALGLCGVRGGYAVLPQRADWPVQDWRAALQAAEPSWPLGAHATAMLLAWARPEVHAWVDASLPALRAWRRSLVDGLQALGAEVAPSVTPFVCVRTTGWLEATALRRHDIAVRDAASFGLPGWLRLSAQPLHAQEALWRALRQEGAR